MPRGVVAQIGTERISANGYLYRKTEQGWRTVHVLMMEERLGRPLADNEYVRFVDGDKTNLDPANLILQETGKASVRRRLAQVEARLQELAAVRDNLEQRLEIRDKL